MRRKRVVIDLVTELTCEELERIYGASSRQVSVKARVRKMKVRKGDHAHTCPGCGFQWAHGSEMKGDKKAHTCICGELVWVKDMTVSVGEVVCFVGDKEPSL